MNRPHLRWIACLFCIALVLPAAAQDGAKLETIVPSEYLVLPAVGQYGRLPLHRDAVEAQLVNGTWKNPVEGDTVAAFDGRQVSWSTSAATDGTLDTKNLRGGYAFVTFDAPTDGVLMLEAAGHAAVYVNGEPHTGDPYNLGWLRLPVRVQKGANTLLFHLAAEKLSARLTPPPTDVFLMDDDQTLPTIVRGETDSIFAAVPVVNATTEWLMDVNLESQTGEDETIATPIAPIALLSVRKVPFQLRPPEAADGEKVHYEIRLMRADSDESNDGNQPLDVSDLALDVVGADDIHIRTFRSRIDGSAQPYAVRSANDAAAPSDKPPGVIVTLHDVGVSCEDHIAQFSPKSWAHIVAPQGRRPHGFDWESWSRIDALEALADARRHYTHDQRRTYLTGQSMGGHGVWHIGATFPDQFAAVGASDGWVSFLSYGGGMPSFDDPTPIEEMILRSFAPSETVKLLRNLINTAVFILHDPVAVGVPVEQARFLRQELAAFHPNFVYQEDPGADSNDESPAHQVGDSQRMMDFFEDTQRPSPTRVSSVDFTTADPSISSTCDFVVIDAQLEQLVPSRVEMNYDEAARAFVGTTSNVARLGIRADLPGETPPTVTLDGQLITTLNPPGDGAAFWFEQRDGRWVAAGPPSPQQKSATRNGTFTAAIDQNVLLVYGTKGNDDENRWAQAKARLDAETFYYRGNGAIEILPDSQFSEKENADRNVILYGNADTNFAWAALLAGSPVKVSRGQVVSGDHVESGDDLAVVMVRPRPGSETALVGVVSGTGPTGMRLTNRLRWFVSGITYPDLMIYGPNVLTEGSTDIRAWGFFAPDWGIDDAEIAWREANP